ncbi:MAG: hypothetical protein JXB26_09210 [Candidatus Aminicenantes bacterium]|nr:hypothetical protein [Candidatus Aminicenantes bacterium]
MKYPWAAVITGDVVKSTALSDRRSEWMNTVEKVLQGLDEIPDFRQKKFMFSGFFRGDSFQILAYDPSEVLRYAILLRTQLIKKAPKSMPLDIRQGIGLGEIQYLNEEKIQESDGQAFRLSGSALDSLKSYRRLALLTPWPETNKKWSVFMVFLDALMQRWTEEQAEAVFYWLRSENQTQIAKRLNIKQPAVQQRLQLAGHFAIQDVLKSFKSDIQKYKA